jgi:hypothetical protein
LVTLALQLALVLNFLAANTAGADEFSERCGELARQARIGVTFADRAVATDETRNVETLNKMSGKPAGGLHNVYGLTHAVPTLRMNVTPRIVEDGDGRICAMPEIAVILGFSEMAVYLARELTDPCRRNVIRAHEDEHVNTWKAHLRAGAQLLTTILRREVGDARIYATRDEVEAGVRSWAEELVKPWAARILISVREAQGAIDTPTSYAGVASRLRSCPPPRR